MDDFRRKLEEFGKKLQEKREEYEHRHGKVPGGGPAARLKQLQQAQADLIERAMELDAKGWDAAKFTLEAERQALLNDFSTWVNLIDAEYNQEI